jgi:hypothetical protein
MFGGITVNGNWRKRYYKELMQQFADLDRASFVRVSRLNCIGHVNTMDSKGIVVKYLIIIIIIPKKVD